MSTQIDFPTARKAVWHGHEIPLTYGESIVLQELAGSPDAFVDKERLVHVSGLGPDSVKALIYNINRKFRKIDPAFVGIRSQRGRNSPGWRWVG